MTNLLVAKEYLKNFYGKYEVYLIPLEKFLLAFITLLTINSKMGYMTKIDNFLIVLVIALMCSFMPKNFMVVIAAAFMVMHYYALTVESAIVAAALFLLMFLLYFRFSPKDTLVVLLTPLCFVWKIPYVIPIAMGLLGGPVSIVSVGCGIVVYYLVAYTTNNINMLSAMDAETTVQKFRFLIDGLITNKSMYVMIAAFAATIIVVYIVRKLSIDHSWTIAIFVGATLDALLLLLGDLMFDLNYSIIGILVGTALSILLCKVIQFFAFNLDYNRTENVQFEDDEYYYYVKAVPKITLATPEKKVKKINTQRKNATVRSVNTVKTVKTANGVQHTSNNSTQ